MNRSAQRAAPGHRGDGRRERGSDVGSGRRGGLVRRWRPEGPLAAGQGGRNQLVLADRRAGQFRADPQPSGRRPLGAAEPGTADAYPRQPRRLHAGLHGVAHHRAGDRSLGGSRLARRRHLPGAAATGRLPVSLGVIGLYAGLLAGLTAAAAGRFAGRIWWPIHKVAVARWRWSGCTGCAPAATASALFVMYVATGSIRGRSCRPAATSRAADGTCSMPEGVRRAERGRPMSRALHLAYRREERADDREVRTRGCCRPAATPTR